MVKTSNKTIYSLPDKELNRILKFLNLKNKDILDKIKSVDKLYLLVIKNLDFYCQQYKKKYKTDPLIHISKKKMYKSKLKKPMYDNQFGENPLNYNPQGLWYACGNAWMNKNNNKTNIKGLKLIQYIYQIDISRINIKKIKTIKQLNSFMNKYKKSIKNINKIIEYLDWKRIYNDYDGLQICPFIKDKIKYGNELKYISDKVPFDKKILINKIIINKIKNKPNSVKDINKIPNKIRTFIVKILNNKIDIKQLIFIWCIGWEVSSGVVWKNYRNIKLTQLF